MVEWVRSLNANWLSMFFVVHGVGKKYEGKMVTTIKGTIPFIVVHFLVINLLTRFPNIVLWLPNSIDSLAPLQ